MRIIAGKARRLPLKTPVGMDTRPTSDQIKETLFNMLQSDLPGAYFLDLFSGSGQMGLEAASRGAAKCILVENSRKAAKCIEDNIAFTKLSDECRLMFSDASAAVLKLEGQYQFDFIFMDPPYRKELEKQILTRLSVSPIVKDDTLIIVEAAMDTDFDYLEELGFEAVRIKEYKTNKHVFIRKKGDF